MKGKREKAKAYRVVGKDADYLGKSFYWQKGAAEAKAKQTHGTLLYLNGYWRPEDEDPDVLYALYSFYEDTLLGLFTDKGRAVEAAKEVASEDQDVDLDTLTYESLIDSYGLEYGVYIVEVKVNELFH